MKFTRKALSTLLIAALLLAPVALAETITLDGTVTASETHEIYAPIGGTVARVAVEPGERVSVGDVLVSLSTTKVYADESGTVTGIFGQPGDAAETIASRYGAVMYIEGESVYTIDASTENAYNSTDTKFVHVGESVYLSCYSDGKHTGTGVITAIQGTDYTVKVLSGEFLVGEKVNVYRGEKDIASKRIGRGELTRANPTAVSGSGSIVSFAVSAGDEVQRGDLLFETLDGTFDGLYMSGSDIAADIDGIVCQINAQQGSPVQKDSVAAVLYPADTMRIEAKIEEASLSDIAVGDPVSIELIWNQDEEITYPGTISMISAVADAASASAGMDAGDAAVTYTVYIDFTPDADTRYGMSAVVTTLEPGEADEAPEEVTDHEEAED